MFSNLFKIEQFVASSDICKRNTSKCVILIVLVFPSSSVCDDVLIAGPNAIKPNSSLSQLLDLHEKMVARTTVTHWKTDKVNILPDLSLSLSTPDQQQSRREYTRHFTLSNQARSEIY